MIPFSNAGLFGGLTTVPDPLWGNVILLVYGEGANANTTFIDHSTVGHPLTANGNVQHDTGQSVQGQSIMFDGTGDYISTPDTTDVRIGTSGDFCLECYAYITNIAHVNMLFDHRTTGTLSDYEFFVDTAGKLNFNIYGSGVLRGTAISTGTVSTSTVKHLAISRQGTTIRLFIDGTLDGTATQSGTVSSAATTFNLGHSGKTAGQDLEGWANWFRFTKGAARYTASFTPPTTPFPTS